MFFKDRIIKIYNFNHEPVVEDIVYPFTTEEWIEKNNRLIELELYFKEQKQTNENFGKPN
jgi:hypothetical protein